jgi:hypothetical protein
MTPKEKAEELVEKFRISKAITESYAKQCALIAVDEILKTNPYKARNYWQEVKTEIELL